MKLFTLLGTEVRLHWSIFIPLAITSLQPEYFMVLVMCFIIVTLHEFGHILAGKQFGVKCPTVILSAIGGAVIMDQDPPTPWSEFVIALCGPLVNAFMLLVALAFGPTGDMLLYFIGINVFMLVFNLIPAFPMDGGRVLHSLLWRLFSKKVATEFCVAISFFLCASGIIFGIYHGIYMLVIVSVAVAIMALGATE